MFESTRQAITAFMEESGKSQRQLSKEIGLSTSVISQFLNSTYPGDNQEVAKTIEQYLSVSKERLNIVSGINFYPDLYNTKETLFCCYYSHRHNDISLISGDAGAGKTTALQYYADTHTGVIFVTANAYITTATAILGLICKKLGRQVPGRRAALMNTLVEQLSGANRLIIIDEADHLSLDALQAVRNLNDEAHCGIVLSGNDKIYRQMLSPRWGYEFEQIRTRIIVRKKVYNEYTEKELETIFPGLNQACIGYLLKLACAESLRTARKLYEVAAEVAAAQKQASRSKIKHRQEDSSMDFIEKIVGLMGGKAAQTDTSAADAPEPEAATPPQDAPAAKEGAGETEQAREQERLSKLSESERLKLEQISKDDEIASLKAELARRDLQAEVIAKLDERRLPVSIADLVQYGDRDSTMESLDKLMGVFETAVQQGVMLRLRRKTPEGLGIAASHENSLADPFAKAFSDALKK